MANGLYYMSKYEYGIYESGCEAYAYDPNILIGEYIQVYLSDEDILNDYGNGKYLIKKLDSN